MVDDKRWTAFDGTSCKQYQVVGSSVALFLAELNSSQLLEPANREERDETKKVFTTLDPRRGVH